MLTKGLTCLGFASAVLGGDFLEKDPTPAPTPIMTTINIDFLDDIFYSGNLFVGEKKVGLNMQFNTKETGMFVVQKDCKVPGNTKEKTPDTACPSKAFYDPAVSSSAKSLENKSGKPHAIKYPYMDYTFSAYKYQDSVCISEKEAKSCVPTQQFYSVIQESKPFNDFDGMLGLNRGSSFITNLVATKNYKDIFAIHIGESGKQSHITFGGVNTEYMKDSKMPVDYVSTVSNVDWRIKTTGLKMGTAVPYNSRYSDTYIEANFNGIQLPSSDFTKLTDAIKTLDKTVGELVAVEGKSGFFQYKGNCPKKIPSLDFTFENTGKKDFTAMIPSSSWLKQNGKMCDLMVSQGPTHGSFVLGRPFIQHYYTVFDGANNQVGFTASKMTSGGGGSNAGTIIIIVVVVLVIIGLGVGGFVWYKKRQGADSDARQVYKEVADKNDSD